MHNNNFIKVFISKKYFLTHLEESFKIGDFFNGKIKYSEITTNTYKNKLIQDILSYIEEGHNEETFYNLHNSVINKNIIEYLDGIELISGYHRIFNLLSMGAEYIPFYVKSSTKNLNTIKNDFQNFKIDDSEDEKFDLKKYFLESYSNFYIGNKFIKELNILKSEIDKYGFGNNIDSLNNIDSVKRILEGLSDSEINTMIGNMPSIANKLKKYKSDYNEKMKKIDEILIKYENENINKDILIRTLSIENKSFMVEQMVLSAIEFYHGVEYHRNENEEVKRTIDAILSKEPEIRRMYLEEILKKTKEKPNRRWKLEEIIIEELNFLAYQINNHINNKIDSEWQLQSLNIDILLQIDYKIIKYLKDDVDMEFMKNYLINHTDFSISDFFSNSLYKVLGLSFLVKLF